MSVCRMQESRAQGSNWCVRRMLLVLLLTCATVHAHCALCKSRVPMNVLCL